ncbi:hypothetical protein TrST_g14146 [Triparma strigata]|uniref:Impact N-terminal domain-containing protein n=1 Tax=Triparma strigata TaxID=1606541 RepID=A0A9W7AIG4_9STRA|nr:hypothetical protein TrST_g14146 [Triparma strigata]
MSRLALVDDALDRAFLQQKPAGSCRATLDHDVLTVSSHIRDKKTSEPKIVKLLEYNIFLKNIMWKTDSAVKQDRARVAAALAYLQEKDPSTFRTPKSTTATVQSGSLTTSRSPALEVKGSTTMSIIAFPVSTPDTAERAISSLKLDPAIANATCLASAYLLPDGSSSSDDDGEKSYGTNALSVLRALKAHSVVVVVARFYGGVDVGAVRHQHVKDSVKTALVDAGHQPGERIEEVMWRKGGEGNVLGGEATGTECKEEVRRKRLAKLMGGNSNSNDGAGENVKKKKKEVEIIEILDSDSE